MVRPTTTLGTRRRASSRRRSSRWRGGAVKTSTTGYRKMRARPSCWHFELPSRGRLGADNIIREQVRRLRRVLEGSRYQIENYRGLATLIVADATGEPESTSTWC